MTETDNILYCRYENTEPPCTSPYVWPVLTELLAGHRGCDRRAFDLGCGNGTTANMLFQLGYDVTGIDVSESGIALGRNSFPHLNLHVGSVYDDLAEAYGQFPLVVSLEVIEHCF